MLTFKSWKNQKGVAFWFFQIWGDGEIWDLIFFCWRSHFTKNLEVEHPPLCGAEGGMSAEAEEVFAVTDSVF